MGNRSGLLSVGITHYPAIHSARVFDMGGIGVVTSTRAFDIEQPPVAVYSTRPFDISGSTLAYSTRPFDILGSLLVLSTRPFDIIEVVPTPVPGTVLPGIPVGAVTALSAPAAAGATTIQVGALSGIKAGSVIDIDGEIRTVESVS